jgi:hypothetical protein
VTIVGHTYLERGEPVVVVAQWRLGARSQDGLDGSLDVAIVVRDRDRWRTVTLEGGPRNVMIRRAGGELVVRPFRGLRRPAGHVRTGAART